MAASMSPGYSLRELSLILEVPLNEAGEVAAGLILTGLATLGSAQAGQLSFLSNPRYAKQLAQSQASAFILDPSAAAAETRPCLVSQAPYVTYARASQLFARLQQLPVLDSEVGAAIHPMAVISPDANIEPGVSIGAYAVIEAGVSIGKQTCIGAGAFIGQSTSIGQACVIYPNVAVYHNTTIGDRVILHSGAVIGADGFGFAFDGRQSVKIAQLGKVVIGSDVEVGAGSTIDRGALDDTVIGDGVKIDNQVQIGHNCVVGDHTVICGCSALAGSTTIGRYCVIGGGVGITGHLTITDKVSISAMSMVTRSIDKAGVFSSGTLLQENLQWRRNALSFNSLAELSRKLKGLEKRLSD
jgi:UDP-3-O-[3-hydroxymyristoyl] glucosamine N-acyltransferase